MSEINSHSHSEDDFIRFIDQKKFELSKQPLTNSHFTQLILLNACLMISGHHVDEDFNKLGLHALRITETKVELDHYPDTSFFHWVNRITYNYIGGKHIGSVRMELFKFLARVPMNEFM